VVSLFAVAVRHPGGPLRWLLADDYRRLALAAVCVPLLAVAPFVGAAGLAVGCLLVLAERTGKAVRSQAESTLLAHAAGPVGLGRGFGVHKGPDEVGALADRGAASLAVLVWLPPHRGSAA
jgi:hypothetical protein